MRAKFTFFDKDNNESKITVNPDTFIGIENIYLIESRIRNTVVIVNEPNANIIVDNRLFRINIER
jgi:hypothetical protein